MFIALGRDLVVIQLPTWQKRPENIGVSKCPGAIDGEIMSSFSDCKQKGILRSRDKGLYFRRKFWVLNKET